MKIMVTGATGFIGSAIVEELRNRGHGVVGLARSENSASALSEAGIEVHRGDIVNVEGIISALNYVDAVIHTAFNHDFSRYAEHCQADGRLLDTMAGALEGSNKVLIATSATVVTGEIDLVTEHDGATEQIPRGASERFLSYADRGVQTGVVRLPPTVHGAGDIAFIPALIALARKRGVSAFIDDGVNRWPAVHRKDAAGLFCDAVEQSRSYARYHAVAENGIPFRKIAEAIGEGLEVPIENIPRDRAEQHFGWLASFAAINNPVSSDYTQEVTGWKPSEKSLIETMTSAGYFDTPFS